MADDLIEPKDVTILLLSRTEGMQDRRANEPLHGVRGDAEVVLSAQVVFDRQGEHDPGEGGSRRRSAGYIVVRAVDMAAAGVMLKPGDMITKIGKKTGYVLFLEDEGDEFGHWEDGDDPADFYKFAFADRQPTFQPNADGNG